MVSVARLSVVKQSSFGLRGQYGCRVTRVNTVKTVAMQINIFLGVYKIKGKIQSESPCGTF